jgi:hypothetical protein
MVNAASFDISRSLFRAAHVGENPLLRAESPDLPRFN